MLAAGTTLMLCVPHDLWSNLYGVLFSMLCMAVCLSGGEPVRLCRGERVIALGWAVFLSCCAVTSLRSYSPAGGMRATVFYAAGAGLLLCSRRVFRSAADIRVLFGWIYIALAATALYGLAAYAAGLDRYGAVTGETIVPRLGATLEHGINYGEFAAMALPIALCFTAGTVPKGRRAAAGALLLPGAAALALTYARTGWIALGLAVFIILVFRDKKALIPAIVSLPAVFLLPGGIGERALSMLRWNDGDASGRFTLWRECMSMLGAHWLRGVGPGPENFYHAYLPFSGGTLPFAPPHANMGLLAMFLSLGIVGGGAYLLLFFGVFPRLFRAIRIDTGQRRSGEIALLASLAGAALADIPEHLWFYPRICFFWCVLCGAALGLSAENDQQPPADPDGC